MMHRGNKKDSGQARMTRCAWIIQLYNYRYSLLNFKSAKNGPLLILNWQAQKIDVTAK
jgi:hypothetical protein